MDLHCHCWDFPLLVTGRNGMTALSNAGDNSICLLLSTDLAGKYQQPNILVFYHCPKMIKLRNIESSPKKLQSPVLSV